MAGAVGVDVLLPVVEEDNEWIGHVWVAILVVEQVPGLGTVAINHVQIVSK